MPTPEEIAASLELLGTRLVERIVPIEINSGNIPLHLNYGHHYFLTDTMTLGLPAGRADKDGFIYLNKAIGTEITLQILPENEGNLFEVNGQNDDTILYDVDRPIAVWWKADNQVWVI